MTHQPGGKAERKLCHWQSGTAEAIGNALGAPITGDGGDLARSGSLQQPEQRPPALRRGGSTPAKRTGGRVSFGRALQDDDRGQPSEPAPAPAGLIAPPADGSVAAGSQMGLQRSGAASGIGAGARGGMAYEDTAAAAETLDRLQHAADGGTVGAAVEDAAAPPAAGMDSTFSGGPHAIATDGDADGSGSGSRRHRPEGDSPTAGASTADHSSAAGAVSQLESQLSAVSPSGSFCRFPPVLCALLQRVAVFMM